MADSNFGFDGEEQMEEDNRIREYLSDLNNRTNDQEEMMLEIMEVLNETVTPIPDPGRDAESHINCNFSFCTPNCVLKSREGGIGISTSK